MNKLKTIKAIANGLSVVLKYAAYVGVLIAAINAAMTELKKIHPELEADEQNNGTN